MTTALAEAVSKTDRSIRSLMAAYHQGTVKVEEAVAVLDRFSGEVGRLIEESEKDKKDR